MKNKYFIILISVFILMSFVLGGCADDGATTPSSAPDSHVNKVNNYISYPTSVQKEEGFDWPERQMLPTMATLAETLDSIRVNQLTDAEKVAFTYLQGIVNKKKPRIYLYASIDGGNGWHKKLNLELNIYDRVDKFKLIEKYKDEISGIVLYDRKAQGNEMINLACTVAGIKNALPVDVTMKAKLDEAGLELPVVEDLTGLTVKTRIEVYNYLYENYWEQCQHRLLFSLSAVDHKHQVRDMAAATGGAIVWLDNRLPEEKEVFKKFLADMKPGESMVTGWYTEERSGIGAAAEFGLSTVPSDYFENSTVFAGMNPTIVRKPVPDKPELENKVYIAVFLSDGDNVQYCEHKMADLWNNKDRGQMPINWTISPALVDFAPGMLNYYYETATENDFFASGPSGLGYSLLIDELNSMSETKKQKEKVEIVNLKDPALMEKYAQLTQIYQNRAGFRVITAWDLVNDVHMNGYEKNTRYLYGMTYQNWERLDRETFFTNDRLPFSPNTPCYAGNEQEIITHFKNILKDWDQESPLFLNAQGDSWNLTPAAMKKVKTELEKVVEAGKVEILRGDHYFALLNEANKKPFDLSLSSKANVTASSNSDNAGLTFDGNPTGDSVWVAEGTGEQWLKYDLGGKYTINRYVIRHAGENGQDKGLNTKAYIVEVSLDGETWTIVDDFRGNTENVTDIDIDAVEANFVRITVKDAGSDGIARIADVEIYGYTA